MREEKRKAPRKCEEKVARGLRKSPRKCEEKVARGLRKGAARRRKVDEGLCRVGLACMSLIRGRDEKREAMSENKTKHKVNFEDQSFSDFFFFPPVSSTFPLSQYIFRRHCKRGAASQQ